MRASVNAVRLIHSLSSLSRMLFLLIWSFSALAQTLLFYLGRSVATERFHMAARLAATDDPERTPSAALMIPVAGRSPAMERALLSLLQQEYPGLSVLLATHGKDDPARDMVLELVRRHPRARHVECGPAVLCGQKNQNLLDCLKALEPDTAIYVFSDANHVAKPDFVRQLVRPIMQGQARFCTGYRRTRLFDTVALGGTEAPSVAFHALNRFMGLLETLPVFTQPWGGALAVEADAFRELDIRGLWSRTVVDDSSLAGLLVQKGIKIRYCPGAILDSPVAAVNEERLDSWFFRQLFYPKFYTYGPWLLIGAGLAWFAAACLVSLALPLAWLTGLFAVPGFAAVAALTHLGALTLFQELLRKRIAPGCPRPVWRKGLFLAVRVTYATYARTILSREMVWHGLRYRLAADGRVLSVQREMSGKN